MAKSAEHQFIAEQLDRTLVSYSNTRLFGVLEAERAAFDYACVLLRDFSRPLISQVLWKHHSGVDKDLRTLLHDGDARLKVYLVSDTTRNRVRIEEVLRSYRRNTTTAGLLRGLRLMFIPADFDADRESERDWLSQYLRSMITNDLLFGVLFGGLTKHDLRVFMRHGGPVGLKTAILHEVTARGLLHTPTFMERLGYSTSGPIREALATLSASGLVQGVDNAVMCLPSVKGRLLLDLMRATLSQARTQSRWSLELIELFEVLGARNLPRCEVPQRDAAMREDGWVMQFILEANDCDERYSARLLGDSPETFYSDFDWSEILAKAARGGPDLSRYVIYE